MTRHAHAGFDFRLRAAPLTAALGLVISNHRHLDIRFYTPGW
jgi:hypothetical protein